MLTLLGWLHLLQHSPHWLHLHLHVQLGCQAAAADQQLHLAHRKLQPCALQQRRQPSLRGSAKAQSPGLGMSLCGLTQMLALLRRHCCLVAICRPHMCPVDVSLCRRDSVLLSGHYQLALPMQVVCLSSHADYYGIASVLPDSHLVHNLHFLDPQRDGWQQADHNAQHAVGQQLDGCCLLSWFLAACSAVFAAVGRRSNGPHASLLLCGIPQLDSYAPDAERHRETAGGGCFGDPLQCLAGCVGASQRHL